MRSESRRVLCGAGLRCAADREQRVPLLEWFEAVALEVVAKRVLSAIEDVQRIASAPLAGQMADHRLHLLALARGEQVRASIDGRKSTDGDGKTERDRRSARAEARSDREHALTDHQNDEREQEENRPGEHRIRVQRRGGHNSRSRHRQ
jgi:hypothetical protein